MAKKILVVEDDMVNIKLLEARLQSQGFEVLLARDGDVGLEKAKSQAPDLIIMDVEMPRMNGYQFVTAMQKDEALKNIPVIVLTAHEEMQGIFNLKGVSGYLVKPVNFDLLFEKMKTLVSA